ncbi:MAG: NAD(P)H-dependent glycerol-3-phosphate dehydrogenase, partial [Clostridia bacterium]|nr:NAD(P)H-dependent glycerol-3-phosphate dehydrogenase [Clostridia bacterium]
MKITVLGSGGWGTALALLLLENGHDVTLWSYAEAESKVLQETGENPMLKGVPLPKDLVLTSDMTCVRGCGAVVLATPSFAVRETARKLKALLEPGAVIISVSKGIEKDTSFTLTEVIASEIGKANPIVALSGPSHAEEVGRHVPTGVVSASENKAAAELVQDLFMNERFRVYASPDVVGVEMGAALKNVIALCAGCCDGMGFGDNTKAMLMTRGIA